MPLGAERFLAVFQGADGVRPRRTFIDAFDVRTSHRQTLYKHNNVMSCVGASVNSELSLLGTATCACA